MASFGKTGVVAHPFWPHFPLRTHFNDHFGQDRHRITKAGIRAITLRRFFGGEGIYAGAVMIGMVFSDVIYFKTDAETRKAFVLEKSKPFSFLKRSTGETIVTTWFALPDRLYDDADEFAAWARAAHAVAARSLIAKKRRPALKKKARHPAGKRRA